VVPGFLTFFKSPFQNAQNEGEDHGNSVKRHSKLVEASVFVIHEEIKTKAFAQVPYKIL
jgi:hypothetical protein